MSTKLSKAQAELLAAMRAGVRVLYMDYGIETHFFRMDTRQRCSAPARALFRRHLVKWKKRDWRGGEIIPNEAASDQSSPLSGARESAKQRARAWRMLDLEKGTK